MVVEIVYEGRTIQFSSELKSKEYYEENKKKFNENCNVQYCIINGRRFIGSNSWLFKTLKPKSYQDFFDKYLTLTKGKSLNPNIDYTNKWDLLKDDHYGRTLEDLIAIARFYKSLCPYVDYPLEEFFDDLVNHIIIETYDGHQAEIELENILVSKGFNVEGTDGDFDAKYGVDLIVTKNNRTRYIQVKPLTTFLGNKNEGLINDRLKFFKKQKDLNNLLGGNNEIIYMLYDKTHFDKTKEILWFYKGDKVTFKLTELIDDNGYAINRLRDFTSQKLILKY